MKHIFVLLLVICSCFLLTCNKNGSDPSYPLVDDSGPFSFEVTVQDLLGNPKPGVQVTPKFLGGVFANVQGLGDSLGGQATIYKVRMIAQDSSHVTVCTDSIYLVYVEIEDFLCWHGYTDTYGRYECNDTLRFPHTLRQLDTVKIPYTTVYNDLIGWIATGRGGSVKIELKDTMTNTRMSYYTTVTRGKNEYAIKWSPSQVMNNTSAFSPEAVVSVGVMDKSLHKEDPTLVDFDNVKISDDSGSSQKLYLIRQDELKVPLSYYEMPPRAPGGLDARFSSDRMVEVYPVHPDQTYDYRITVQSDCDKVNAEWSFKKIPPNVDIALREGSQTLATIRGQGQISNVGKILTLRVEHTLVPVQWALGRSYPNPFNVATYFDLDIPIDAYIFVGVYNLRGELVTMLVDGEWMEAGYHDIVYRLENSI